MNGTHPGRRAWLLAGLVIALHVAAANWAAWSKSVTADEVLYVTSGYFIDRHGDYRVQPENGILPQRLHGLAALWTGAPAPPLENNEYWRLSSNLVVCHQFFYETGHDHVPMLRLARALNTLFSAATAALVFAWAWRLAGGTAAFAALALYAADPNLLAHAALATSDLAAVFFLLASASAFWWQLERPGRGGPWASALVFGLACVAKFSAVLLVPLFVAMLALHFRIRPAARARWLRTTGGNVLAHAAGAFAVIWACYGFKFSGFSPALPPAAHYSAPWSHVLPYIGWQGVVVKAALAAKLLPEAFLYGYAWVIQSARARAAFLAGDYSYFGWVSFFPLAFLWKSTEATLLGAAFAFGAAVRRGWQRAVGLREGLVAATPLLAFAALYTAFSLTSHLNIGHRHILPLYPALYIACGAALASFAAVRVLRLLVIGLVALQLAACLAVAPHFLAYFNRLAGGPANGYRLLVDSSLDWGQDLPTLKTWLDRRPAPSRDEPIFLSYFGSGEPAYYGFRATRLPFINGFKYQSLWYEPQPGWYCISATMLQQVYSGFGGVWTPALEDEYRALRPLAPAFRDYFTVPEKRPELLALAPAQRWEQGWQRFDKLRFARLCYYLRAGTPEAAPGYSILVYRVSATDLALALDGNLKEFAAAVSRRAAGAPVP